MLFCEHAQLLRNVQKPRQGGTRYFTLPTQAHPAFCTLPFSHHQARPAICTLPFFKDCGCAVSEELVKYGSPAPFFKNGKVQNVRARRVLRLLSSCTFLRVVLVNVLGARSVFGVSQMLSSRMHSDYGVFSEFFQMLSLGMFQNYGMFSEFSRCWICAPLEITAASKGHATSVKVRAVFFFWNLYFTIFQISRPRRF